MDTPHKHIAQQVHASLYSTNVKSQQDVLTAYFDSDAVFEDPVVKVQGRSNIFRQFRMLAGAFTTITADVHSITDSPQFGRTHLVVIDAELKFTVLYRLPIKIRIISRFEFNEQQKIVKHEDLWSLLQLAGNVPLLGFVYTDMWRFLVGEVSDRLAAWWGIEENSEQKDINSV